MKNIFTFTCYASMLYIFLWLYRLLLKLFIHIVFIQSENLETEMGISKELDFTWFTA